MDRILIIDGNSLLYRGFFATTESIPKNSKGKCINAVVAFDNMIRKAIKFFNPSHLIVVFDKGRKSFRYEIFPEYKANRPEPPLELIPQFDLVRKYLDIYNIKWVDSEKYEADDLIGSLTRKWFIESCILTSDRDLLQLSDFLTNVYLMKHGVTEMKECNNEYFEKNYGGLKPEQLIDFKALVGDTSDNVPGVEGIGDKTAIKLLKEYSDIKTIYNNLESLSKGIRAKLEHNKSNCELSKKLVTINTNLTIKPELDTLKINLDERARYKFCSENEMLNK